MALFHGLTLFTCPNGFLEVKWPFDLRSRFWRSNGSPGLSPVAKSHAPAGESWTRRPGPYQSSSDRNSKGKGRVRKVVQKVQKAHHPCRRTCMANGTALNRVTLFVSASTPAQVAQRKGLSLESVVAKDSMCALNLVVSSAIH